MGPVDKSGFGREGWRAGALGFLASSLLTGAVVGLSNGRLHVPPVVQPTAFNHRTHVRDREIDCSACHHSYEKQTFSGLPTAEVCAMCHAEAQGKSEEEAKLVRLLQAGVPLAWRTVDHGRGHYVLVRPLNSSRDGFVVQACIHASE